MSDLERGTVRIERANGQPVGAGFVVADRAGGQLIVTCAHVVHACSDQAAIPEEVTVRFLANGQTQQAQVKREYWLGSQEGDVAVLSLGGSIPAEVQPLPLGSSVETEDQEVSCVGFPNLEVQALIGSGKVRGKTKDKHGQEILQLTSQEITLGFSGAPLWDSMRGRVIGMVSDIAKPEKITTRQRDTAFGIPTETLLRACPALAPPDEVCPYRGLEAFTEADATLFFGRERVIKRILNRVRKEPPFLAVLGPSGSGKSSLIQAGVIPGLKEDETVGGRRRWEVIFAPSADQPLVRLEEAGLRGASHGLVQAVQSWRQKALPETRLVLIIDQAEELFVPPWVAAGRAFLSEVTAVLGDTSLQPATIILVMRDDFFSRFSGEAGPLAGYLEHDLIILTAQDTLDEQELENIVKRPAEDAGWTFDDGLADAIVRDAIASMSARDEEDGTEAKDAARILVLPLLESTLTRLWEKKEEGKLTWEAYRKIGGVTGALTLWADQEYLRLEPPDREIAKCIFKDLVNVSNRTQDNPGSRQRKLLAEVCPTIDGAPDSVMRVVQALTDRRLLVTRGDIKVHQATVEIVHDELLRRWELLAEWLDKDKEFLIWKESVTKQAKDWMQTGAPDLKNDASGKLIRGWELNKAEDYLDTRLPDIPPEVRRFIKASVTQRESDKKRRIMITVGGFFLTFLAVVFLAYAAYSDSMRQVGRTQLLGTLAINQIEGGNLEEGLRNAVEAVSISRQLILPVSVPSQAETALHLGLAFPPPRKGMVLSDHMEQVNSAAYSPHGRYIVTAGQDGVAYIYYTQTNKPIQTLKVGKNSVTSAVFSPDETYLATSSTDKSVKMWNVETGEEAFPELKGHTRAVWTASFNPTRPNGDRIVTASLDNSARVWNPMTGEEVFSMTTRNNNNEQIGFRSAAYSPDGKFIVTGNTDGNVRIWHAVEGPDQGKVRADLVGHTNMVLQATFSPDGKYVASASADGTSRIWETETWQLLHVLRGHTAAVRSAAFSPDSKSIVTASEDGTARIWSVKFGEMLLNVRLHSGPLTSATYSLDGRSILTTGEDKTARVWEPIRGEELPTLLGHSDSLSRAAYSPDGARAVTAGADKTVRVWDTISGTTVLTLTGGDGHTGIVYSAAFSPDPGGKYILTSSEDKTAKIWDAHAITGSVVLTTFVDFQHPVKGALNSALFSPDGKRVVTACADGSGRIWDIATGKSLHPLEPGGGPMHTAAYSPDGKFIATSQSNGTVVIWNAETGVARQTLGTWTDPVITAFYSPDGKRLVITTGITARVLDVDTGRETLVLTGHNARVNSAIYSHDGRFIVTSSRDRTTRIWNAETGEERATLRGHTGWVTSAVFSPDGTRILTSSYDRTARQYFTRLEDLLQLAGTYLPGPLPTPTP